MRKLISILLFIFCCTSVSFAQNTHKQSNDNTNEQFQGTVEARVGFINAHFADTTAANLSWVKNKPFAQITTGEGAFWLRNATATKWIGTGTASISISSDSSSLIVCSGVGSCDTIPVVSVAPITNFTIISDTSIIVCGVNSCDTVYTLPINYNQNVVNSVSVVNGATIDSIFYFINGVKYLAGTISLSGASSISLSSDSTYLLICNSSGCDTFYFTSIAPITNFTVLNDTTIVVCGTSCDTLHTVPTNYNSNYVNSVGVDNNRYVDTVTYTINGAKHIAGYIDKRDTLRTQLPLYVDTTSVPGQRILKIMQPDGLIGACPVTWDSLLVFTVAPCNYVINQTFYSSPQTTITLPPADSVFATQYLFVVDTNSVALALQGTPSASPTVPQADPASQLALTSGITIGANATAPSNVVDTLIYDENTGVPAEWAPSSTGTITVNFADVSNPYHGTKDAFVSTYRNNSTVELLSSTEKKVGDGIIFSGYLYFNGVFTNKFKYQFFDGSTAVSNVVTIYNNFGLNPNNANIYQHLALPSSAFTWTGTYFNRLVITHVGNDNSGTGGYFMDYYSLQNGIPNIVPQTDYSNKQDSNYVRNDSLYWCVKGVCRYLGKVNGSGGNDTAYVAFQLAADTSYALLFHSNRAITPDTLHFPTTAAGAVTWGSITGTLSSQTDLQDSLNLKLNKADSTAGGYYPYSTNPKGYLTAAVTSISQGYGIVNTPNPITSTGTIKVDSAALHLTFLGIKDSTLYTTPYQNSLKLNTADSSSMLAHYLNDVGYGLTKSGQIVILDTSKYATASASGLLQNTDWGKFTNKTDSVSLNAGGDSLIVIKNSIRSAYKLPSGGGSAGVTQIYTSGATVTANSTTTWLIINPASIQSALTITLAASPSDGQKIEISFGGTITSGNGVVTTLTLSPNSGQTLVQSSTPSYVQAGDAISYRYNSSNTSWYRIN